MKTFWKVIVLAVLVPFVGLGTCDLWGQANGNTPAVLHIVQSQTTSQGSQNGFPTFLAMYKVLDGGKSPAAALALTGTLSLKNYAPTFSEVLWILA